MNRIKELINSISENPTLVLHLGAGTCHEHHSYKTINPSHTIYVEPEPTLAKAAIETCRNRSDVNVIPFAIATENGSQTLNITNNPRFSSLLLPSKLLEFYPNVEVEKKTEVKAITLTKLCRDEKVSKESDNLLVVELQGMEKEISPQTETETLLQFKWIIIRSSEVCLYTPSSGRSQISLTEVMQNAGFMVLAFEEPAPPFVNLVCIRNTSSIKNVQLSANHKEETAHLQSVIDSISSELTSAKMMVQSLTDEKNMYQQLVNELSKSIDTETASLNKAQNLIQSLTDKKDEQLKRMNLLRKSAEQQLVKFGEAESQVRSLTDKVGKQKQQIHQQFDSINAKTIELDEAKNLIQSGVKKDELQEQLLASLRATVKEKEKEISGIQQTLRVNSKLILKSDSDFKDLQRQHRVALQHQEQQHALLCELKGRLQHASDFYNKLNLKNLIPDAELLE